MPSFEFKGKRYELCEDGYLANQDDWNRELAAHIAG